jgi:hypothetical protein
MATAVETYIYLCTLIVAGTVLQWSSLLRDLLVSELFSMEIRLQK